MNNNNNNNMDDPNQMDFYDQNSIMANAQSINWARTFMAIIGGVTTGILGITAFRGFLAFVVIYIATSVTLLLKMGFAPGNYMPGMPIVSFLYNGIGGHLMSHLLFWTMFYGIVHVY